MPKPILETVRQALEANDRDLKIRSAINQAWADVQSKIPDIAWFRRASTVRGLMWEYSVDRVMGVVNDDPQLVSVRHYDTASFIADDQVLFRLKKADTKLFSSNYPTPLAGLFHRHSKADLFGHEGHQRVEIVHTFNRFFTAIDWIGVVAREGKKLIWDFELRRGGEGAEILTFPSAPFSPAGPTVVKPNLPETGRPEPGRENEAKE